MGANQSVRNFKEVSITEVISAIRETRNRQIEELMYEPHLMIFLEHYFNKTVISDVKKAFLNRDLTDLKNSPLDLSFYSSLITHMKENNSETVDIAHKLFLLELKTIFQKYAFQ